MYVCMYVCMCICRYVRMYGSVCMSACRYVRILLGWLLGWFLGYLGCPDWVGLLRQARTQPGQEDRQQASMQTRSPRKRHTNLSRRVSSQARLQRKPRQGSCRTRPHGRGAPRLKKQLHATSILNMVPCTFHTKVKEHVAEVQGSTGNRHPLHVRMTGKWRSI